MPHHYAPIKMATKKLKIPNGQLELSYIADGNVQW